MQQFRYNFCAQMMCVCSLQGMLLIASIFNDILTFLSSVARSTYGVRLAALSGMIHGGWDSAS